MTSPGNIGTSIDKQPLYTTDSRVRHSVPMRKYSIAYLSDNGEIEELIRVAPALPIFETAFGALGRDAVVTTRNGAMPVEDLLPGDEVRLSNGEYEKLLWRGSMEINATETENQNDNSHLIRITAGALGPTRPSQDLILGPTAHLLHRATGVRTLTGKRAAFFPVKDFIDGAQFITIRPATPVNVYQLGFARQETLLVNGIEIESLHPGPVFGMGLRGDMQSQYLSLFPHKHDLGDFGDMRYPRLRQRDLDLLE